MSARDRADVAPHLDELARRELIRPVFPSTMAGEAEYTFWHALLRDVAYGELTRGARLAKHQATAAWITDRAGAALGEDAEIVVAHLDRALELATATGAAGEVGAIQGSLVDALLTAADTAMRTEVPRAVGLLRRALDLLDAGDVRRPAVLEQVGRGLVDLEEYGDAIAALEEARRLHVEAGREVEAALFAFPLARAYLFSGHADVGDRIYDDAEAMLRRHRGPALAGHLARTALRAWTHGRNDDALRLADEALTLARSVGIPEPEAALMARGLAHLERGHRRIGEEDLRQAIRSATACGDVDSTLTALDNLATELAFYSIPDALAVADEEIDFARSRGIPTTAGELSRFMISWMLGQWDEALRGVTALEVRLDERGDAYSHLFAATIRIAIELERGEYGGDPSALAAEARSFGRAYALSNLYPFAARLALAQGRRPLANALIEELTEALGTDQLSEGFDAVRAAVEAGRPDLARRLRDCAIYVSRRTGLLDAIVTEAEGDYAAARGWYEMGAQTTRTVGLVPNEAYALAGLGRCLLALGETEDGIAQLRESRAIWEGLKAVPRIAEIDALLATAR